MKQLLSFLVITLLIADAAWAIRESRPTPTDPRIRVMTYHPDDVYKFTGYYGYQASIELAHAEEVVSISMGDTTTWQIVPAGHRVFLKPMEKDATTNMTIITNKRTYYFELYGEEAQDIRDPDMVFNVKFLYPDEEDEKNSGVLTYPTASKGDIDLEHPEKANFNYSVSGDEEIAPLKVYDDGNFTFLEFRITNADLPAIFAVDEDLRESMVNYRLSTERPGIIILEQVFKKLAVKHNKKVACVFNEAYNPY